MAILKIKCDCGRIIETGVGDKIYNNKLYWFQSYFCCYCGKTVEMDSEDMMPSDIKEAIIAEQGSYGLIMCNIKDRKKTEFLLKKMPEGNLFNFKPFLEKESEEIIRGTQNEVLIIKNYLNKKGMKDCIVKRY